MSLDLSLRVEGALKNREEWEEALLSEIRVAILKAVDLSLGEMPKEGIRVEVKVSLGEPREINYPEKTFEKLSELPRTPDDED